MALIPEDVHYFPTAAGFRRWLARHHATATALWVGYYKVGTGVPSLTWPESVDEALCVGWIDGIRQRIDDMRYAIRFTPRKPGSVWSAVNLGRVEALRAEGRMKPAGLKAYEARVLNRAGQYSYEQRPAELPPEQARLFKRQPAAWAFFQAQPPSYRRAAIWWVISAKQAATRERRLAQLLALSAEGCRLPQFTRPQKDAE